MNSNKNQFGNKRLSKLATEKTAFKDCRSDMLNVNFEIGKTSYSVKIFLAIVAFAVFFGAKLHLKQRIVNSNLNMSSMDIGFWIFIGCIFILTVISAITQSRKPTITVSGKTLFYNGNCWECDEISCVKCSKWFERLDVYSAGKKVLSFPWELDNSELFIAWTKKCGILFEDKRFNYKF